MASAYKGVVISPSLTKTAGGQDLYVPLVPSAGGGDVIPGNLQVVGNLAVGGTTSLSGAVSTGALTSASVTTPGSVSAASVTSAGSVSGTTLAVSGASTLTGAVTCGSTLSVAGLLSALSGLATPPVVPGGPEFREIYSQPFTILTGTSHPFNAASGFDLQKYIGTTSSHAILWWITGNLTSNPQSYMGGLTIFQGSGESTNPGGLPVLAVQLQANGFSYANNGGISPVQIQYTNSNATQVGQLNAIVLF